MELRVEAAADAALFQLVASIAGVKLGVVTAPVPKVRPPQARADVARSPT